MVNTMNRHYEIHIVNDAGNICFNAELTCPGEDAAWRYWKEGSFDIFKGTKRSVITTIANIIGAGHVSHMLFHSADGMNADYFPDKLGNVWHNNQYLSPVEYLPNLIAEAERGATRPGDAPNV
jgi:hypothetical protein